MLDRIKITKISGRIYSNELIYRINISVEWYKERKKKMIEYLFTLKFEY